MRYQYTSSCRGHRRDDVRRSTVVVTPDTDRWIFIGFHSSAHAAATREAVTLLFTTVLDLQCTTTSLEYLLSLITTAALMFRESAFTIINA